MSRLLWLAGLSLGPVRPGEVGEGLWSGQDATGKSQGQEQRRPHQTHLMSSRGGREARCSKRSEHLGVDGVMAATAHAGTAQGLLRSWRP